MDRQRTRPLFIVLDERPNSAEGGGIVLILLALSLLGVPEDREQGTGDRGQETGAREQEAGVQEERAGEQLHD